MSERVPIGKLSDIPPGEAIVVTIRNKDVAVFHTTDGLFAIDDLCPHMGASLAGGFVEDGCVTCPWHYWRFKLADGSWGDNPKIRTASYPVHIEGDDVLLELPDLPTGA